MWSLILWGIAPIFNAIMDIVENENFSSSIFYRNPHNYKDNFGVKDERWNNWWYKRESDDHVKIVIFGYRPDAWHLSKSIMIILVILSGVFEVYIEGPAITYFKSMWINGAIEVVIRGLWWNAMFSLFYNVILRSKTWA